MFKKEIFRERALQLGNNKELSEIAGVSPGTMSKYLNPSVSNIPTADVLYNIADNYHISVDWLIGKTNNKVFDDTLESAGVCRALVSICESFPEVELKKETREEVCFDTEQFPGHFMKEIRQNEYVYISFPCWEQSKNGIANQTFYEYGNCIISNHFVNEFLLGYSNIRNAKNKNDFLTTDHYEKIIDEQLRQMERVDKTINSFKKKKERSPNNSII